MSAKPQVLLGHYLKQLKLPAMRREYASIAAVCEKERADYHSYLLRLCEHEVQERERRSAERRIKQAGFPVVKTLDNFDFKAQPSLNEPLIRELARGDYITAHENVLLMGSVGTGKTHLACALGFNACSQSRRVCFTTTSALVTRLLEARESRQLEHVCTNN